MDGALNLEHVNAFSPPQKTTAGMAYPSTVATILSQSLNGPLSLLFYRITFYLFFFKIIFHW